MIPAIHQTSTYAQRRPGEFVEDYDYARSANPTRAALEQALGELEGGLAVAFSSGLAAEHALITVVCEAGSHIVLPGDLYGGTLPARRQGAHAAGACATTSSTRPTSTRSSGAVRDDTRLIWVETPTNPLLNVVDIAGVVARRRDALVAVDNTFATPVNQRPLELGADFVVHSTTKYLGGHSDVVGGRRRSRATTSWYERLRFVQNAVGAVPGPFDCFLVHRGLRTLHLRMEAHARSAARGRRDAARDAPGVTDVRWPGFSGMVSFRHPDADRDRRAHAAVHARRVARRRRVADRGAAGDDPPVGRGLGRRRAARPGPAQLRDRGAGRPGRRPAPGARRVLSSGSRCARRAVGPRGPSGRGT